MVNSDIKLLRKLNFTKCFFAPDSAARDDNAARVYVVDILPEYLRKREIIEGDVLNYVVARDGQNRLDGAILCRFLRPCAADCETLGDEIKAGCNMLHMAARNRDKSIAELLILGARTSHFEFEFYSGDGNMRLFIYSDHSVLMRNFADCNSDDGGVAFSTIAEFIKVHHAAICDAEIGSALQKFRLFAAQNHIECWFEAFLPK